ncbi:hypothetical protein NDU88_002329 [Pleurodeles waltl]|uniref:Uncharacterized protein n=1 Tax=Pleurodeles waltl TaxID=8319 RepID=A0AAV7T1R4_PLEWA|nr:hypothetical protein NDU88_002329 [Pleurodeles waltl]
MHSSQSARGTISNYVSTEVSPIKWTAAQMQEVPGILVHKARKLADRTVLLHCCTSLLVSPHVSSWLLPSPSRIPRFIFSVAPSGCHCLAAREFPSAAFCTGSSSSEPSGYRSIRATLHLTSTYQQQASSKEESGENSCIIITDNFKESCSSSTPAPDAGVRSGDGVN